MCAGGEAALGSPFPPDLFPRFPATSWGRCRCPHLSLALGCGDRDSLSCHPGDQLGLSASSEPRVPEALPPPCPARSSQHQQSPPREESGGEDGPAAVHPVLQTWVPGTAVLHTPRHPKQRGPCAEAEPGHELSMGATSCGGSLQQPHSRWDPWGTPGWLHRRW